MNSFKVEAPAVTAVSVVVTKDALSVDLSDGRSISVPLGWYPRLSHGSVEERNRWSFVGRGQGIHWSELDEDISVENLLTGKPSAESQKSFKTWLDQRARLKAKRRVSSRRKLA